MIFLYHCLMGKIHFPHCRPSWLLRQNQQQNLEFHTWLMLSFLLWRILHGLLKCILEKQLQNNQLHELHPSLLLVYPILLLILSDFRNTMSRIWAKYFFSLTIDPTEYVNKVSHETGNFTFHESWVTNNDINIIGSCWVFLCNNCKKSKQSADLT